MLVRIVLAVCVALLLLCGAARTPRALPLPQLLIDKSQTSVSGLSSGGFEAVQLHVAYSATFKAGAGVVAGGPYGCAQGSIVTATGPCMQHNGAIPVASLVSATNQWAANGWIDPVSHLQSSKVYLFSGTHDTVVKQAVMDDLFTYYKSFVPQTHIVYKNDLPAEHAMVTDDFGNGCGVNGSPYIDDCDFDLAGAILKHLYGALNPRNDGTLSGSLVEFDQTAFVNGHGMAASGWAYIPQACSMGAACRLHVALHGCKQNTADIGQVYVRNTGYNRWADTNKIVVLYPQTSQSAVNSCWDWWGYDNLDYAKKSGPQMAAIKAMVDRVSSGAAPSSLPAPTGVGASAATNTSMQVAWNPVQGAVGYNVYREGAKVNNLPLNATNFTDTGLAPGTTYHWAVTAVDGQGGESPKSAAATGTTTGASVACFTANNVEHVAAGRAYVSWGVALAKGSNNNMGLWNVFITTTLKQTGPNFYEIASC